MFPSLGAAANRHRLVLHLEVQFAVVDVQPAEDVGDRHVLHPRGSGHRDLIRRKGMFDDEPQFELGAGDAAGLGRDKPDRQGQTKGLVFDQRDGIAHRSFDGKGDVGMLVVGVQAGEDDAALAHRQAAASPAAHRDVEPLAIERHLARDVPHLGHGRQVIDRNPIENHVPVKGEHIEGSLLRGLERELDVDPAHRPVGQIGGDPLVRVRSPGPRPVALHGVDGQVAERPIHRSREGPAGTIEGGAEADLWPLQVGFQRRHIETLLPDQKLAAGPHRLQGDRMTVRGGQHEPSPPAQIGAQVIDHETPRRAVVGAAHRQALDRQFLRQWSG